jgi:hypothetical protein
VTNIRKVMTHVLARQLDGSSRNDIEAYYRVVPEATSTANHWGCQTGHNAEQEQGGHQGALTTSRVMYRLSDRPEVTKDTNWLMMYPWKRASSVILHVSRDLHLVHSIADDRLAKHPS